MAFLDAVLRHEQQNQVSLPNAEPDSSDQPVGQTTGLALPLSPISNQIPIETTARGGKYALRTPESQQPRDIWLILLEISPETSRDP